MAIPTRISWHIEREGPTAKLHLASRSRVGYGLFVFFFAAAVVIGVLLSTTGSSPGSYYFLYGFLALLGIPVAIAIRHLNAASTGTVELDPESRVLRRTKGLRMMAEETVGIPSPGTLVLEHYVHMVRTSPGNGPGSTRHQSMQRDYYRLSVIPERVGRNDNISAIIEDRDITIKAPSSPQKAPLARGAVLVVEGHDEKAVRKIGHFVCEELELLLLDASLLEPRLLEPADWHVSLATLRASIRESFPPPPPGQETPAFQRVRAGDQSWQIVCGGYSPRGLVLVALVGLVVAACIGGLAYLVTDRLAIVILLLAVVLMLMLFRYRVVVSPSGVSVRRTLAGVVPLAPSDSLAWSEISEVHSQGGIVFSSGGVDLRISISDELQRAWIGGVLNEFLGRTSLDRVS